MSYNTSPSRTRLAAGLPPTPSIGGHSKPLPNPFDSTTTLNEHSTFYTQGHGVPGYYGRNADLERPWPNHQANHDPFVDDAAIPLSHTVVPKHNEPGSWFEQRQPPIMEHSHVPEEPRSRRRKERRRREPFFSRNRPWFIYTMSLIQTIVFIVELARNGQLTGSPIEIKPQFNPMIGPSPYVLINMGARYVPCMRNQQGVQNSNETLFWPCPDQTDQEASCTLSQLCGFGGVPNPTVGGSLYQRPAPNQWWRFIVPIFLHAGIIHIGFNILLQLLLGGDMERALGPLRLALVYFSSGIFGFVLGGNLAASGIESTGASGAIFGIIALTLLDILYTWPVRPKPWRDLIYLVIDIAICFVLGLLPGLDNFSHIGGFVMGLVLGVCLLRSPTVLRKRTGSISSDNNDEIDPRAHGVPILNDSLHAPLEVESARQDRSNYQELPARTQRNRLSALSAAPMIAASKRFLTKPSSTRAFSSPLIFFRNRKPLWWIWWLLRAGALVGVIAGFIVLIKSFYSHVDTQCPNCKYLSCLPVSNWCEIGDLTFRPTEQSSTTPARRATIEIRF